MKKIRVHSVINGILIFYGIIVGLQIIIHILFKFDIVLYFNLFNLMTSILILGSATLFGIISKNDFYKDIEGRIIDKYEIFGWNNLTLSNPFIILSLLQIFISFVSADVINADNLLGLHLKSDHDKFLISTLILYPFPTYIFIIRSFFKRSIVNEKDLIKINRRERIKTEDLEELHKKVDLQEWIKNDPVLQIDKELFSKLVHVNCWLVNNFDDSLKGNKEFILGLPSINYTILEWLSHFHIEFKEIDFTDELMYKIFKNSDELAQTRGSSEFAKIYTKKIIEIYSNIYNNQNEFTVASLMNLFYSFKNILKIHNAEIHRFPTLELYKVCINDRHIIEKELEHCPYCK